MTPPLTDPLPGEAGWLGTPAGRVRWYATGSGRPVLLLHSFNAAASSFEIRPLYVELGRDRRTIAFDWPGFGRSERPDVAYDARLFEAVLDTVMRAIASGAIPGGSSAGNPADASALDVVALSLPAQYAAVLAAADPTRFARLVLVSPTGFGRFGGQARPAGRLAWKILRASRAGDLLFGVLARRRVIEWFLRQIFADASAVPRPLVDYSWRTAQQPGAARAPLRFICGLLDDPAARAAYAELAVPALLVFGTAPRFTDPAAALELRAANPNLRIAEIADSGDLPQWERPEATVEAVRAFLGQG